MRRIFYQKAVICAIFFILYSPFTIPEEYISFNIYHSPPQLLVEGKDLNISIKIYEPENVSHVFLSYRNIKTRVFKIILLKKRGALFTATIPGEDIIPPWIEYFISAIDVRNEPHNLFYHHKHPYRVTVQQQNSEPAGTKSPEERRTKLSAGYEQNQGEASLDVTVIERERIKLLGLYSIVDVIKNSPGIDTRNVMSGLWQIGIRGFAQRNNQLQVRIDGRKLIPSISQINLWNGLLLSPADMNKIEIIKGPASYLYGANSSAGIIDISTELLESGSIFTGEFAGGSLYTHYGYLRSTLQKNSLTAGVSANFIQSNYYQTEKNALSGGSLNLKAGYSPVYHLKLNVNAGYNKSKSPFLTYRGVDNAYDESSYTQIQLNYNKFNINTYWNEENLFSVRPLNEVAGALEIFRNGNIPKKLRTDDFRIESTYSFTTGLWNRVLTGGEIMITAYRPPWWLQNRFTEKGAGIFLLDEIKPFEKIIITLSYRFDWNSVTEPGNSYMGSITVIPFHHNIMRISQREGFRKPHFFEYTDSPGNLTNETIKTTQFDYTAMIKDLTISFSAFYNEYKNFIEFFPEEGMYKNVAEDTEGFGGEIGIDYTINKYFSVFVNYWYSRFIDLSTEDDEYHLNPDSTNPKNHINAGIILNSFYNFSGSLTVNYTDSYKTDIFLPGVDQQITSNYKIDYVKPYTSLNLKTSYKMLNNRVEIGIWGKNILFKKHLETPYVESQDNANESGFMGEEIGTQILGFISGGF